MNTRTLPKGHRGSSLSGDPHQYGTPGTPYTDNSATNSIQADPDTSAWNVLGCYGSATNVVGNEELSRIQAWLSPLEPLKRHQDVSNHRLDGVGDWVLQGYEYRSWCTDQDDSVCPTLLCYGGQGVGKTYISSLVIDTLCEQARGKNTAILSLYCDYQAREDQSAVNLVGSLLRQVAFGAIGIPGEIQNAFDESKQRGGKGLRLPDMLKLFVKTISSIERVYICVDAVDELLPQERSAFLRALRQIIQDAPSARLFLTARSHVLGGPDSHLTEEAYIIDIVPDQEDIARYISQKLEDGDQDPGLMTDDLRNDIIEAMLEKASEMFLLVAVNVDAILGETTLARRKKMLQKVATAGVNLDSVYGQTLQRIREQQGDRSRLGMEVLMWISHAKRPLRIDELLHALAVEMGSTDLDPENIPLPDTVLRSCLGLAVVDNRISAARLIHYTLQEYLSRPGILPGSHKTLAETCLTYLNYKKVNGFPANNLSKLNAMPFLQYSSVYWGSHAKMELSDLAKSLAVKLLNRYDNHISAAALFNRIMSYHGCLSFLHLFPGLHCASYFGIVEVVAVLIEVGGCDINQRDCMGFTPLIWASLQGNEKVVRLLLAHDDISPDKPAKCDRTPLWWASEMGHEEVVRLLLTRYGVNPNVPDNCGRTPLWAASDNGHEGVVRLLLSRKDIDPDKPDHFNRTPLSAASGRGHEGVVRILLSQTGVDPDKPDNCDRTPLWGASDKGYEGVVRLLLLRRDINPNKPNNNGRTPLFCASRCGHGEVVRLLLTRDDVDPEKPDDSGQSPLLIASTYKHIKIVALLRRRIMESLA